MNESKNVIWMNEIYRRKTKLNNPDILTLVNRFLEIARKDWLAINEARDIDYIDSAYEDNWNIIPARTVRAEIIPLVSKHQRGAKNVAEIVTVAHLNEKMYFFYNNGGSTMEL